MKFSRSANRSFFRQKGIGIVEVMVALVVVSMGVLGMASLQLTGIKYTSSGYSRSLAVLFSENLAARMRSNQEAVSDFHYAGFDSDTLNCNVIPVPFCQATFSSPAQLCDHQEMAVFDLYSSACGTLGSDNKPVDGVADSLADGRLQVECDDAPCVTTSNYTMTITWNEGRTTDDSESIDSKRVQVRFNP